MIATFAGLWPHGARTANGASGTEPGPGRAAAECRRLVRRRALWSAASSFVPIPGIDFITDVAVLSRLITDINARFGIDAAELERARRGWGRLDRVVAYRLSVAGASLLAARVVTPGLLLTVLRFAGVRLTLMEATRLVPLIGQVIAAGIAYVALTRIADRHIEDCMTLASRRSG